MTLNERAAYIKGLADGLKLDENNDTVKVLNAVIDMLTDLSISVTELDELYDELSEQVDAIDDDLSTLEEDFDDYVDDEDCDCCDGEEYYEVTCPTCNETVCLTEDMLLCGEMNCPSCGEVLEFDFDEICDCEDENCDCHKED